MEIKVNIAHPEQNKSKNVELDEDTSNALHGKRIGDTVNGDVIGFDGYTFKVTGGSDRAGFPMRKDVAGTGRHKVLITGGTGLRENRTGRRVRRTVAGNTVYDETVQVNVKVVEEGDEPLFEEPSEDAGEEEESSENEA